MYQLTSGTYTLSLKDMGEQNLINNLYLEISDLPNTPISTRASETFDEQVKELKINIYPNPTPDMVIIELSQFPLTDQARYRIMNIEGKLVMEGKLNTHQDAVLDLTQLQTGSYRILLLDQDELIQESQIVKQ